MSESGYSQHASLMVDLFFSSDTPVTKELASTHMSSSWTLTHTHTSPVTGSFCFILFTVSVKSSWVGYHPFVHPILSLKHLLCTSWCQLLHTTHLHTGRYPRNLPQKEKTFLFVMYSQECLEVHFPFHWKIAFFPPDHQAKYFSTIFRCSGYL